MKDGKKEINIEKQLTDHFAIDIGDAAPSMVNAEIEKDEWMLYPDGNIQKGYGEKHEKGGIEVGIPDGTKIITNSINIGGDLSKKLSKDFDIKLKAGDTFASVMEKYSKKIGLNKVLKDQEEYFKELRKQEDKKTDESTYLINNQFLSGKINELEAKKNTLNADLIGLFNVVFEGQESKKEENPEKYDNNPEEMKYGGVSHRDLAIVADRMGITLDRAMEIATGKKKKQPIKLNFRMGGVKKYVNGDEHSGEGNPPTKQRHLEEWKKLKEKAAKNGMSEEEYLEEVRDLAKRNNVVYDEKLDTYLNSELSKLSSVVTVSSQRMAEKMGVRTPDISSQHARGQAFDQVGEEGNIESTFEEIKRQFPRAWREVNKDVTPKELAENFDNKTDASKKKVEDLQKAMNKIMEETADYIIENKAGTFTEDQIDFATKFKEEETFKPNTDGDVKSFDGLLGLFTATRQGMEVDVATPDDLITINESGKYTVPEVLADKELFNSLSPETQERMKSLGENPPEFKITQFNPAEPDAPIEPEVESEDEKIIGDPYIERQRGNTNTYYPYRVPSSIPMQPQLAQQVTLNRIDPLRLRYEEDHQALRQGMERVERSGLTPAQQLAVNASMVAGQQKADALGQMQAVQATAQNYAQADQYNAQVGDKEQMLNKQLASKYFDEVSASLNAKRLNEEERDVYMHQQALEHYDQNRMNAIYANLFDYNPGYFNTMQFAPNGEFQLNDSAATRASVGVGDYSQMAAKAQAYDEMQKKKTKKSGVNVSTSK